MKTIEIDGYTVNITVHHDEYHGAPWEENDGHGIVSGWEHRDKRAGERVLNSNHGSKRFYDFAASVELAKKDGWGLSDDAKAELAKKLGRQPTRKQIIAKAVELDFEYLRGWCNNEWHYQGYTTEITTPAGETLDGDSCWGFEGTDAGEKYMLSEAESSARHSVAAHIALVNQTQLAEVYP